MSLQDLWLELPSHFVFLEPYVVNLWPQGQASEPPADWIQIKKTCQYKRWQYKLSPEDKTEQ